MWIQVQYFVFSHLNVNFILNVSLQLKAEEKVDQGLLPPKKMLGKNSKSLVELRQKELELYLQTLLLQFTEVMPTLLAKFLHFHLYVSIPVTFLAACSGTLRCLYCSS